MMKNLITFLCILLMFNTLSFGQKKIVFMPQWTPQAQFAGYYVAFEKGFYKEAGIDVEIRHIPLNSTESVSGYLLSGDVQIVGQQLIQSIISRSDGNDIVNVMQMT